ncbi:hypothetical protein HPT27_07070 [Permianibacter sp. IMCC34836]|uniref:hypothetical protein n=1 Tax=Permianibacter fluminis TaxID=2738515 RepID=UPI001551D116|nr:hypothetical protein [Permianibacter fluminis]NQD36783.1 hypothetical protein [Permianibacter fluminis]
MIVPQYWAEARRQQRTGNKQITVRRFGWSDASQDAAQQHAEQRVEEALARVASGESLARREAKIAYNGAEGLPIREEIVSRHGDTVITRNSYGALCLNTANVLFVDMDFSSPLSARWLSVVNFVGVMLAIFFGVMRQSWPLGLALFFGSLLLSYPVASLLQRQWQRLRGGAEQQALAQIRAFASANPDWHLRVYRTPAGFRVLVMQRTFDANEAEVQRCFTALAADPVYQQMCRNQRCFRARVSAKPWRIGMAGHLRPRPGVWPVAAEHLPERQRWLAAYDAQASQFAACRFVEALGSQRSHPDALAVQQLHDALCRADSALPLA